MTWHAPTVRFYVGRAALDGPPGYAYPEWALNALGGIPCVIDLRGSEPKGTLLRATRLEASLSPSVGN